MAKTKTKMATKTAKKATAGNETQSTVEHLRALRNALHQRDAAGNLSIKGLFHNGQVYRIYASALLSVERGQQMEDFCVRHNIAASLAMRVIIDRWLGEMLDRLDAELTRDQTRFDIT